MDFLVFHQSQPVMSTWPQLMQSPTPMTAWNNPPTETKTTTVTKQIRETTSSESL